MFRPPLNASQEQKNVEDSAKEGDIEIRRDAGNPREDRGDFIDYEEVD